MRALLLASVSVASIATAGCAGSPSARGHDVERQPTELSEEAIGAVRAREQGSLQTCWQAVVREVPDVGDVRLDIDMTIAASGAVVAVGTRGTAIVGLSECIEAACRVWRFPASSEPTLLSFPVVFSPQ